MGTVTHLRGQMRPRAACGIRNTLPEHRRQRGYATLARGRWPQAEWIAGNGRYASAAYCGTTTVMLFASLAEAEHAKSLIDSTGCGHACRAEHELVDLGKSPAAVP